MRRRSGDLLELEQQILVVTLKLRRRSFKTFHGFLLAKEIADQAGARSLTGHGTLYKALSRLENQGFLTSYWEDPGVAMKERRPVRRLYEITPLGKRAVKAIVQNRAADSSTSTRRIVPSWSPTGSY